MKKSFKFSLNICFLLHLHFFDYPFVMSIKCQSALIINAFNWKSEGWDDF